MFCLGWVENVSVTLEEPEEAEREVCPCWPSDPELQQGQKMSGTVVGQLLTPAPLRPAHSAFSSWISSSSRAGSGHRERDLTGCCFSQAAQHLSSFARYTHTLHQHTLH